MYKVRFVLKQFIDALDDVSFSHHNLVPYRYKLILHSCFKPMNELNALTEQTLEEFLFDVSYLSVENLCKYRPYSPIPVIYVCPCKTQRYHFTGIIAEQMQLESMTPAHGTLSVLGKTSKNLVEMPSYIVPYRNHRAVNERYACTPAPKAWSFMNNIILKNTRGINSIKRL